MAASSKLLRTAQGAFPDLQRLETCLGDFASFQEDPGPYGASGDLSMPVFHLPAFLSSVPTQVLNAKC
jgi:hypothetical protein